MLHRTSTTTALFALVVLLAFREWFSIRLDA